MKNIIVIGAGNGIGLDLVKKLTHEKNQVFAITRSQSDALDATSARVIVRNVVSEGFEDLGNFPEEIHGVVYCPGSIMLKPFNRIKKEEFIADYEQNVLGAISTIQYFLPQMKKSEGASVVLFSTVASKLGMPFHASIASAKGAVEGLGKSLAAELASVKIRVNVIAPSLTDTNLASGLLNTPEKREAAANRHPIKRVGSSEDMSALAQFLLSDAASWITGQIIGVDGGLGSLKV
jgi:3-oxoacyl-[acyl-carrier protein] reductase